MSKPAFPTSYTNYGEAKYHALVLEAPGVLRVSFSRGKVNAWIEPMWRELEAIFRFIKRDPDVGAVVLSGENRCFTAGLDLTSGASLTDPMEGGSDPARKAILMQHWIREFQDAISQLEQCHKPVIAAVHNVAYGLAIDILSACDVRIATKDARFSVREVDAGLAADIGTLQRFPKIVANDSWVRELCYTAREFDASEAFQFGFVSRVVDGKDQQSVVAEAVAMASQMASKSPVALRNCKHLLLHARDHSVQDGLEYTSVLTAAALQSDDIPNAMMSVMQKKTPKFSRL